MALEAAIANGFHIAGLRSVYLTEEQAKELSHHSRHHPRPDTLLVAMLLQGRQAVSRWQAICGPSNLQIALSSDPTSLHAAMAATMELVPAEGTILTASRDAVSAQYEAAFFFGGRLCEELESEESPKGWTPSRELVPLVTLLPKLSMWLLIPAPSSKSLHTSMQLLWEMDSRGFDVQLCRRTAIDTATVMKLAATPDPGARGIPAGSYVVASISCPGDKQMVSRALEAAGASGLTVNGCMTLLGKATGTILREVCDAERRATAELGCMEDDAQGHYDDNGVPTPSDLHSGRQVAVVAFR
jgi:nucleoside diphosphate kinase